MSHYLRWCSGRVGKRSIRVFEAQAFRFTLNPADMLFYNGIHGCVGDSLKARIPQHRVRWRVFEARIEQR